MKLDIGITLNDSTGLLDMSLDDLKKPIIKPVIIKKKKKRKKKTLLQQVESSLPVKSEYQTVTI